MWAKGDCTPKMVLLFERCSQPRATPQVKPRREPVDLQKHGKALDLSAASLPLRSMVGAGPISRTAWAPSMPNGRNPHNPSYRPLASRRRWSAGHSRRRAGDRSGSKEELNSIYFGM